MKELDFLRDSVQRLHHAQWFNTHPRLVPISIAEHHYMVAVICMLMLDQMDYGSGDLESYPTLRHALVHDLEEGVTGDMNAVVKRNSGTREALRVVSEDVLRKQVAGLPAEAKWLNDWRGENGGYTAVVKAADKLSMWLYAIEEVDMGNTLMRQVCWTVETWLIAMVETDKQHWLAPWVEAVTRENFNRGINQSDVREAYRRDGSS